VITALPAFGQHHQPLVTFQSPTVCRGDHGFWRWAAKTDMAPPPDTIARTTTLSHRTLPHGMSPIGRSGATRRVSDARQSGLL
jgi:hypothetical protein